MNARVALGLALGLAVAGCGSSESTEAAPHVAFSKLNADVFEPSCTFACHSGGELAAGGLDMKADPYRVLVGARADASVCKSSPLVRVEPGEPEESLVYLKIVAKLDEKPAPCGDVMPAGVDRPALSAAEVEDIRAWIAAGAPDD